MRTHDFFTRVIAANCAGPNMKLGSKTAGCLVLFKCPCCAEEYSESRDASGCCPPEEIYRCPVCRKEHEIEREADACCPGVNSGQPMQCPVCLKGADSFEQAADCCLHTHPTMTAPGRWRVAEAVAQGTPWPDAVAANLHH